MKITKRIMVIVSMLALAVLALVGCGKMDLGVTPTSSRYYLYSAKLNELNKNEYIDIDGDTCLLVKDSDGVKVTSRGNIIFNGDMFTISCDGDVLGIKVTTVMCGKRESSGVLRVDSRTIIGMTATPVIETEVQYYCLNGVTPNNPIVPSIRVTFDCNGGAFEGGAELATVNVDADGKAVLSEIPSRDGYYFDGFFSDKSGDGERITSDTVFESNQTVYAGWSAVPSSAKRYYAYDMQNDILDMYDYVDIYGKKCTSVIVINGMPIRVDGSAEIQGSEIRLHFSSDIFTGLARSVYLIGNIETNGVIRFNLMMVYGQEPRKISDYYCPDGVKPQNPIPPNPDDVPQLPSEPCRILFVAGNGKFADGSSEMTVMTDPTTGKVQFPDPPQCDGYVFKKYYAFVNPEQDGSMYEVTPDTVFYKDSVVVAVYE